MSIRPHMTDTHYSAAKMIGSSPTIKVLTPTVCWSENKYLTCLWSSVQSYGVEVDTFKLSTLVAQTKASQKVADVIHLNWIQRFCQLDPQRKVKSLLFTLRNLRDFYFLKSRGYQLVWTVHNTLSHECNAPLLEKSFRWLLSRFCSDILVMSEYGRQEFARMYGRTKRVHIMPHGNYIGAYPNQISRTEARLQLGIAPHQTVLLYFGQIKPYKGINHLLAAFSQLKNSEVVLLIAGQCNDLNLLAEIKQAAQADSRILLRLEFIKDEDVQVYMNACDWVVLPYQKILNSGSALLALSFGRPVIVPQRGALTELITDAEHGLCYLHDRDLAAALSRALTTPSARWQQMCEQAYALAQEYDWSKIGAQLYEIYQQGA